MDQGIFRKGSGDDFSAWAEIDEECFPPFEFSPKGWPLVASIVSPFSRSVFVVAEINERVVGYAYIKPVGSATASVGELSQIAVLPEFRNRRVGTSLAELAASTATALGYGLLVGTMRLSHRSFFENAGWSIARPGAFLTWVPAVGSPGAMYAHGNDGYEQVGFKVINSAQVGSPDVVGGRLRNNIG